MSERKGPRPDLCQRYARKELAAALPAILDRFIDEATKGSISHAKALMSFAALDGRAALPPAKPKKRRQGPTVSEMLLLELRKGSEPMAGEDAMTDPE